MSDWREEYYQLIADCRKRDHMLSSWEADFLDSIEFWLDAKNSLTQKQIATLDQIWEKATSKG